MATTFNICLGGYVGNGQPEPYNLGTSSIPYRATNSVPPSHRAQVQANEWDPFGPGPNPIPAASVAVAATSAPTAGTENRQWDPFLEEDYKVTAHGPAGGGNTVNDSWTDIQDPQVGGKTAGMKLTHKVVMLYVALPLPNVWSEK